MKKLITVLVILITGNYSIRAQVIPGKQPSVHKPKKHAKTNNLIIPVVYVQGGNFNMGSSDSQDTLAQPVHRVKVSSFYMGKYDVTQAQWKAVMGSLPLQDQNCDECPVADVSWHDAHDFIDKLNKKTGKHYRLPTEAEWEFAARGGSKSKGYTYSGGNELSGVGWFEDNSGKKPHEAGKKHANELGIYDMSGNVWEWCQDWYGADYYANSPSKNPQGPSTGSERVYRGGGWAGPARPCRVAYRGSDTPGLTNYSLGFRLVLGP